MEKEELMFHLIQLSQDKEIPYSKKQLEKMTVDNLQKVYDDYKRKELDEFNEAMADVIISKFSEFMKNYDLIKKDSALGKTLQNKKLFRQDLKTAISYVSPVLPFIGLIEGCICIVGEMTDNYIEKCNINKENVTANEEGTEGTPAQS